MVVLNSRRIILEHQDFLINCLVNESKMTLHAYYHCDGLRSIVAIIIYHVSYTIVGNEQKTAQDGILNQFSCGGVKLFFACHMGLLW